MFDQSVSLFYHQLHLRSPQLHCEAALRLAHDVMYTLLFLSENTGLLKILDAKTESE